MSLSSCTLSNHIWEQRPGFHFNICLDTVTKRLNGDVYLYWKNLLEFARSASAARLNHFSGTLCQWCCFHWRLSLSRWKVVLSIICCGNGDHSQRRMVPCVFFFTTWDTICCPNSGQALMAIGSPLRYSRVVSIQVPWMVQSRVIRGVWCKMLKSILESVRRIHVGRIAT